MARSTSLPDTRPIRLVLTSALLLAAAVHAPAYGQCNATFAPVAAYATTAPPFSVAIADVNNDGLKDVIVGYLASANYVSVYRNLGAGVLGARTDFAIGTTVSAYSIKAADLNGDGYPELLVGTNGVGLRVLNNDQSGAFPTFTAYAGSSACRQVAFGDIDGNGTPDVVISSNTIPSQVMPFLNLTGNGILTAGTNQSVSGGINGLSLVDDDSDGALDVLISLGGTAGLHRLRGNGNGTFQVASLVVSGVGGAFITLADVTGDGRPDPIIPNQSQSRVYVNTSSGPGSYAASTPYITTGLFNIWSVGVVDVNGDGVRDLLLPRSNPSRLGVALGLGGGAFGATTDFDAGVSSPSYQLDTADLNNDGRLDAVMTDGEGLRVFLNTTTLFTTPPTPQTVFTGQNATFSVTAPSATTFQWRRNGVPLTESGHYAGVTTASLTVNQATGVEAGSFDCVVNACGVNYTSPAATLTVLLACPADMDNGSNTGTPDGGVDINDLLYFLEHFEAGC